MNKKFLSAFMAFVFTLSPGFGAKSNGTKELDSLKGTSSSISGKIKKIITNNKVLSAVGVTGAVVALAVLGLSGDNNKEDGQKPEIDKEPEIDKTRDIILEGNVSSKTFENAVVEVNKRNDKIAPENFCNLVFKDANFIEEIKWLDLEIHANVIFDGMESPDFRMPCKGIYGKTVLKNVSLICMGVFANDTRFNKGIYIENSRFGDYAFSTANITCGIKIVNSKFGIGTFWDTEGRGGFICNDIVDDSSISGTSFGKETFGLGSGHTDNIEFNFKTNVENFKFKNR